MVLVFADRYCMLWSIFTFVILLFLKAHSSALLKGGGDMS